MIDATKEIIRGLEDVLVCNTKVSDVDGDHGVLTYRGYDIIDLAASSTFEETTWLLTEGELPSKAQLTTFKQELANNRVAPPAVLQVIKALPRDTHPMGLLRTAISAYGCTDPHEADTSVAAYKKIGTQLVAQIATIGAAIWRISQELPVIAPDPSLSYAGNFLYMLQGTKPSADVERIMDIALVCHADHEIPASTFSAMVVASSLADVYSAITGALGSLKGSLHGGANEQVLNNLDAIGDVKNVDAYMQKVRTEKLKVPGIGHRVYKTYDPRAIIFKKLAAQRAALDPATAKTFAIATALETQCVEHFKSKDLYPNVDYFSGVIYRSLGIDPRMYPPIFAIARTAGWVARLVEYLPQNRLFRPRGKYEGYTKREYVAVEKR